MYWVVPLPSQLLFSISTYLNHLASWRSCVWLSRGPSPKAENLGTAAASPTRTPLLLKGRLGPPAGAELVCKPCHGSGEGDEAHHDGHETVFDCRTVQSEESTEILPVLTRGPRGQCAMPGFSWHCKDEWTKVPGVVGVKEQCRRPLTFQEAVSPFCICEQWMDKVVGS